MPAPARAKTAHWAPLGPKTRPFRHGVRSDAPDDPPLARGTVVAERYRLDGLIGQGGMGQVYAAEHLSLGRRVALKLLRRDRAKSDSAARLRQEAKAASRIGHRAIVQVVDFDSTTDGLVYLAMELLRGESYEDWLERAGSMLDGVTWLAEAARGLHAAHQAGIVHRDIKPDNLFLHHLTDGKVQPKLLDFGLAKATATDLTQVETQAGTLLGTPYYLAPERALGRPLDPRADLYSLGVMLYETLTGNVPFVDDSFMGILARHIKSVPLDPRQAAPDRALPDDLCLVTMALLAKDPADRPASGAAVAELLDRVVSEHAVVLRGIKTGPREVSGPSDETTNLETLADRPTTAPVDSSTGTLLARPEDLALASTMAPGEAPPTSKGVVSTSRPTEAFKAGDSGAGSSSTPGRSTAIDGSGSSPVMTSTGTVVAGGGEASALLAGLRDGPESSDSSARAVVPSTGTVVAGSSAARAPVVLGLDRDRAPRKRAGRVWVLAGGALAAVVVGGAVAMALGGGASPADDSIAPEATPPASPSVAPVGAKPTPVNPSLSAAPQADDGPSPDAPTAKPPADPDAGSAAGTDPAPSKAAPAEDPGDSDTNAGATKPPAKSKAGAPSKKRKLPRRQPAHADDSRSSNDGAPSKSDRPKFKDVF